LSIDISYPFQKDDELHLVF